MILLLCFSSPSLVHKKISKQKMHRMCIFTKTKNIWTATFKTNTMYFVENAMYRSTEKESSYRSRIQQTLLFPQKIILINFLTVLQ